MKKLLAKIRKILKDRKTRQLLTRIVSITAAVVVFITTYALVLPAITMESEANCGIPAHQHDESCYEDRLICGQVESPGHQHTDACYSISKSLICTETAHQHDDSCFDEDGNLTCELAEHAHDDSCYEDVRELVCDIPESEGHEHTDDCYERVLACGMEAHTHSTACYSHGSELTASAPSDFVAVATTELGSYGASVSASTETEANPEEASDAWASDESTAGGLSSTATAADTASTGFDAATAEDAFVPQLEPIYFEQLLTKDTDIYYYHAEEGEEVPENSADIADWKRVDDDTELAPADLLRVYLRYTIPAGALNSTNDIARYRLPSNLHLTDQQMEAINTTVNGIANQYVNIDTLEITDTERYNTYLGIEATEGTRKPSDNINEYFTNHPNLEGQEYINAVVRAENVFDETTEEYLGQDLVFTFTPYTVQKNQHEYDAEGQPTKAGKKVNGWLCFDLHMDQIDWSEPIVSTIEDPAAPAQDVTIENTEDTNSADTTEATEKAASDMDEDASLSSSNPEALNTNTLTEKTESSAEIVFAAKDKTLKIDEISTELHQVELNTIEKENDAAQDEPAQSVDDSATDAENQPESATEINEETYPAVSFEDTITVQAGTLSTDNESVAQTTPAETAITVSVIAEEETFPLGTTMQLGTVEDMDTVASAVEGAVEGQTRGFHAVDISFHNADGEEIEPLKPIKVSMTSDAIKQAVEDSSAAPVVVHIENPTDLNHTDSADRTGDRKENSTDNSSSEMPETDESASLDTTVSAPADENADIIADQSQMDTTINAPVATILETAETASEENSTNKKNIPDTLSFDAGSFSVYVIVYTVDFHYEINGKTVEFSLPGGGFVSLEHVVEVLGIATADENSENGAENAVNSTENADDFVGEVPGVDVSDENTKGSKDEAIDSEAAMSTETNAYKEAIKLNEVEVSEVAKKFVTDVDSVVFSCPGLVWVGKVENETTVGGLKEANGLEVDYSEELTEEQIAEINAQTVKAGDWALISVRPFMSEQTLTVTMKNGDQFVVKVTDAQISTHVITADGEDYIITVTYGPEAGIPDGAELTAKELLPGTEEYETHYAQMLDVVKGEVSDPGDELYEGFAEVGLEVVDPQSTVDVAFARFFDISIWKDDVEIEPLAPVQVEIQYVDPINVDSNAEAEIIHFADDGIERIDPETDVQGSSGEGISSFTYEQSSFSISATLLKYTTGIPNGNYLIIKGAKDENKVEHWYALKADGSTIEVTKNGDTITRSDWYADDAFWTFTNAGNGQYYIQNRSNGNNRLVLYNNIVGNWVQKINVEVPDGRRTVYLKNPDNTGLRFNGSTYQFVLGSRGDGKAEQVYLARMTSEIPQGEGYNLTPAGETDLGDLNAWKNKVENSKIIVDKTASVVDYDNRIYQIDLKALSDMTIIANKVDLELIVDTSRSMYFPANLSAMSGYYFTSIMGNDSHSLEKQLSKLNKNQIYYFIGDGEKATVYALYYAASGTNLNDHSGDQCWKFVDASYMNPPDAGSMNQTDRLNKLVGMRIDDLAYRICNQTREGGGCRLYTASSSITRLAYLKEAVRIASEIVYAVDRNNRIGLVTFNSKANTPRFYDNGSKSGLYSAINNISLAGGTRQDLGLEAGTNLFNSSGRADAQKIAVLITDGAPNMQDANKQQIASDTAWTMIGEKADALKGTNSSNAKLYTLGLSLDMVGGNNQRHLNGLASEEDGVTRHFNASNGPDIVRAVKNLIDTLMYDVTLEAEVTDVLDPAFYPVDQNGNPIAAGDYTDGNGKRYNWSVVTVDGAECWKITYYDQEVGRGEKNADNTIKTPGWQKSFNVKAKEDFLGGNNIETNRYKSSNNRVKPTKYVYKERGTNVIKKVDPPSNAPWGKFEKTPTVNVDELHPTEHSTEWTVYRGTEVTPEDQMKALWDEIKVKQVVKTNGTANNGTTITGGDKKWYSKTDTMDTAAPNEGYSSLPINRYFTNADFNTLLNQLKTQDSAEKTINYVAYGHQPGTITVKLEKEILDGVVDANGKAPGKHITDKEGTPVEEYTITVTYIPNKTDTTCNIGHVTTGTGTDEVKSTNDHKINVFAKKLELLKTDQGGNTITSKPATFVLYRKATDDELADGTVTKTELSGLSGKYVTVQTLTTSGGSVTTDALPLLADNEPYYLVETKAPAGYFMLTEPLKVAIDMSGHNTWIKIADNSTSQTKPDPYVLSNWLQEASIKVLKMDDTAYDPTQTPTYNHTNDTTDASVTYKIINNAGYELPSTGGPGITAIYILGIILTALAASGLVTRKRRDVS